MGNGKLICESHVKEFIKLKAEILRTGWQCHYVSQKALDVIDAKLRAWLIESIKRHPTRGKTFTEIIG